MSGKIVLVDGNSLMHRAFYALPLLDNGEGVYTNAVFGFFAMLFKVLKEENPDSLAVAFDLHGPTFRHEQYEEYKAGRNETPAELRPQFDLLKQILAAMNVGMLSCPRYEADDMLGTVARRAAEMGMDALVVTGDRDAFQLAGPRTTILFTHKGISETDRVDEEYLMERYALTPERMIDLKGLMGDNSDNIPGIPGIGEKTALKLLKQYQTLDETLEKGPVEQKGKLAEKLRDYANQARFSRKIATIDTNAPIDVDIDSLKIHDMIDAVPILEKYKLNTLLQRIKTLPDYMKGGTGLDEKENKRESDAENWGPVEKLDDDMALTDWAKSVGCDFAMVFGDGGAYFATADFRQAFIETGRDMLSNGVTLSSVMKDIECVWTGKATKILVNLKGILGVCEVMPGGEVYDASLADYVINAQNSGYDVKSILTRYGLNPDERRNPASLLFAVKEIQQRRMDDDGVSSLYSDVELPLSYVLHSMEKTGFLVDAGVLKELGDKYKSRIAQLTQEIYEAAGREFNINSTKQLGELLFGEMGLPGGKKTSRGYSTTADILESISDKHEIVPMILEYRKYFKFNNTYIDALLRLRGVDGRIHTSFDQTATATGRISSNEPNLQNIPVRTTEGREIRRAFIAGEGKLLVDCDYSQIELRILAHLSGDERLIEAFRSGRDIHKATAADVYGVPVEDVTPAMRSAVKAVNFGIIYGISDFGLAKNIGVSRSEASEFIKRYFERYPGVRKYMDDMMALGKSQGYVTTILGRRRYLTEMGSSNYNVRAFAQRVALNSPIQGASADIIKIAMTKAHRLLSDGGFKSKLILQVHDELIIESPENEAKMVGQLLVEAMQSAVTLDVPLVADLSIGRDWHECKE